MSGGIYVTFLLTSNTKVILSTKCILILSFLNKFHHNFTGTDYPHHYIIYLMVCLFHLFFLLGVKDGLTSKVWTRDCHFYIHVHWKKNWKTRITFFNWKPTLAFECLQIYKSQQTTFIWHVKINKSVFKCLFILAYWQMEKHN